MCGRFVPPDEAAVEAHYQLHFEWADWFRRFNTAPTNTVPIVYEPNGATREGALARWGLIPPWWSKEAPPTLAFNARSEEAAVKPMWRRSFRTARCLMPAAGWYEWCEVEKIAGPSGRKVHQPYYFHAPGEEVFSIAGLWSRWRAADGAETLSCALLTRDAAPGLAAIHHRMPVVLAPENYAKWLSPKASLSEVESLVAGSREDFAAYRVGAAVNNVRNDSPDLVRPAASLF